MDKSPDAFRTISEVAEVLETPAHVLRFWESRFPQIRPVKRAGGRRYYRPADVALLTGIKRLLHDEGLTIRGVQKILREHGVRHVAALSGHIVLDETEDAEAALEAALAANFSFDDADPAPQAEVETAQVVALETALRRSTDSPPLDAPAEVVALFDSAPDPVMAAVATAMAPDSPPEPAPEPAPEAAHWADPELDMWALPAESSKPAADAPLVDRLAALPAGAFAEQADQALALLSRLHALHDRLISPPPPVQY